MEGQKDISSPDLTDSIESEQLQQNPASSTECHSCTCAFTEEASSSDELPQRIECRLCGCCESLLNPETESDEDSNLLTNPEDIKKEHPVRPRKSKVPLPNKDDKKPKLRTSKDVYDRLKWDSSSITIKSAKTHEESLDVSSIYVGYKDRFLGMCELSLDEFEPGGDIPFHRVYYFRTGGPSVEPFIGKDGEVKVREDNIPDGAVYIWDRDSRTDLIFKSGNTTVLKR